MYTTRLSMVLITAVALSRAPAVSPEALLATHLVGSLFVPVPLETRDIAELAIDIGKTANISLGFEEVDPPPSRAVDTRPRARFDASTVDDALKALERVDPNYRWRVTNGVVVIRSVSAWSDPHNPLNQPVELISWPSITTADAFGSVVNLIYSGRLHLTGNHPQQLLGNPLSLQLPSGSVLDLLNEIARTHKRLAWSVLYRAPEIAAPKNAPAEIKFTLRYNAYDDGQSASLSFPTRPPSIGEKDKQ